MLVDYLLPGTLLFCHNTKTARRPEAKWNNQNYSTLLHPSTHTTTQTHFFTEEKMAKRFIDTDKWKAPWFEDLSGIAKAFHYFYYAQCDHAGVWQGSFKQFHFFTGFKYDSSQMQKDFGDRIIPLSNGAFFMPDFIQDQYGTLSKANSAHRGVIKTLNFNKIQTSPFEAPTEELPSPCLGAKDKDTVKDKDQDKDQEKEELERVTSPLPSTEPPPQKTISESDVIALYNETCAGHGEIKRFDFFFLPPEARTNFINRSGEPGYRTKDQWREFFKKVLESDFLLGKKTGHVASLPWLLKPDKFVEVATGVHKNRQVAKETASEANAKADALFENIVRAGRYQFKRADYTETDMKALEGIGGLAVIFDCTDFTKKTVIANLRTEYKKALEAM